MRTGARASLLLVSVLVLGVIAYGTLVEPNRPVLRRLVVPCPGLRAPVTVEIFSDVDFPEARAGRSLASSVARQSAPDAIFVPGDYLDRFSSLRDAALVRRAGEELAALPAKSGRFIALGEEETEYAATLRSAWSRQPIVIGDNDVHVIETPGGPIEIFIADDGSDPAPWGLDRTDQRPALRSRGRFATSWTTYAPAGFEGFRDVEITLAFRLEDADTFLDLRFGWSPDDSPGGGDGWHLVRHAYDRAFYLDGRFPGEHRTAGRTRSGYVPGAGIWHRARIRLWDDGRGTTHVQARFWPERGVEPRVWLVDATDVGPSRRRTGTIAFGARAGVRQIADLRVGTRDGVSLLDERFVSREAFDGAWRQPSRLASWARAPAVRPRLVLSHNPDIAIDLALIGAPPPVLVIAGHTHGGQIALPWVGPLFTSTHLPRRLAAGLGAWRGIPLFVTPGIGTSLVPIRLGVPPEVALLTLAPVAADTMPGPGDPR